MTSIARKRAAFSLRLQRVHYPRPQDFRDAIAFAPSLTLLHVEVPDLVDDQWLEAEFGGLAHVQVIQCCQWRQCSASLQELLFIGACSKLTKKSVKLLMEKCPKLKKLGDLSDWNLTREDIGSFENLR